MKYVSKSMVRCTAWKTEKKALKINAFFLADRTGLEPATSAVTGQHSNQLNYRSSLPLSGVQI